MSAFLIFLVQPMVGKRILPWFGGAPAVWTLCLAFYQTALFLGYAYADWMIRFVQPRLQFWIHAVVVAAALVSLPVLPEGPLDILGDSDPTLKVLWILSSSVALPFLVLASTGPLVQAWFARAHPALSPYALYAVSNVGSFLALFFYPFVIEPRLPLSATSTLWSYGFGLTGVLVLACALPLAMRKGTGIEREVDSPTARIERIGVVRALVWLLLSGTAVTLLMGVSNKLCLDVASVPFLWILPLATYLITFVLAFSTERSYRRGPYVVAAAAAYALTRLLGINTLIVYQVLAYCLLLFAVCMILHGELYRLRPEPRALTVFYLCVSAGGAMGGLFVGIVAPAIFEDYYELPVSLLLTVLLVLVVCWRDPASLLYREAPRWHMGLAGVLTVALFGYLAWRESAPNPNVIHKERSFFGVLAVKEVSDSVGRLRSLKNGTTIHGVQFQGGARSRIPTSYYGRATGLGLALKSRPHERGWKIGVIGLGVGTLAAYGVAGDSMRFYEIDPVVAKIAGPGGYFTFVGDSAAKVDVVLGDARLSLEDEQRRKGSQQYDFLVLDAFSSDAIPIHLMTREAFEVYFAALAPDGLLAVHVSNRHFKLMGLVSRLAAEVGADSLQIKTLGAQKLQSKPTDLVIASRDPDQLSRLRTRIENRHRQLRLPPDSILMRRGSETDLAEFPLWTDDYSDLMSVIGWD